MSTDAFLHEEDQAAILQLDQGRENQEQRPKQQHRRRGAKQIHAALEKTLRQAGEIVAHLKQQQILAEKITAAEAEQGQASQRRHDGDADKTPSDPFIAGISAASAAGFYARATPSGLNASYAVVSITLVQNIRQASLFERLR